MKIALFTIKNVLACWYAIGGYKETLERMGHTVVDCSLPNNTVQNVEHFRKIFPTVAQLNEMDCVFSSYHEYVQPWLKAIYGDTWTHIRVPIISRYDESMDRADLGLPGRMPELLAWGNHHFFPAAQDAAKFGGTWLPFGADTTIFNPCGSISGYPSAYVEKKFDVAFIGSMYPLRQKYMSALAPYLQGIDFRIASVMVQDLSGTRLRESTLLLAENYRAIKIFFCLPTNSHLLVEKIFEIMASDTLVLYPRLMGDAAQNMSIFKDGEDIIYYEDGYVAHNAKQIKFFLEHAEERDRIARAGGELIRSHYTLEQMLEKMLEAV